MSQYSIVVSHNRLYEEEAAHKQWCLSQHLPPELMGVVESYYTPADKGIYYSLNRPFKPGSGNKSSFHYMRILAEIGDNQFCIGLSAQYFLDKWWDFSLTPSFRGHIYHSFSPPHLYYKVAAGKTDVLTELVAWVHGKTAVEGFTKNCRLYMLSHYDIGVPNALPDINYQTVVEIGQKFHLIPWIDFGLRMNLNTTPHLELREWHNHNNYTLWSPGVDEFRNFGK